MAAILSRGRWVNKDERALGYQPQQWLLGDMLHHELCFLAATKQLYKWYFPSVRLSVTPFWLCSHHRIIMKFSGVITNDQRKVHAKGQGQRSKVKVTEVTTQLNRFRTVTPVWIHIWWWNDAQCCQPYDFRSKKYSFYSWLLFTPGPHQITILMFGIIGTF